MGAVGSSGSPFFSSRAMGWVGPVSAGATNIPGSFEPLSKGGMDTGKLVVGNVSRVTSEAGTSAEAEPTGGMTDACFVFFLGPRFKVFLGGVLISFRVRGKKMCFNNFLPWVEKVDHRVKLTGKNFFFYLVNFKEFLIV
jgi:hypothetical protein